MPHLLVLVSFGRAGGSYFLPSFVPVPVCVGGLFFSVGFVIKARGVCFCALSTARYAFPGSACFKSIDSILGVQTSSSCSVG